MGNIRKLFEPRTIALVGVSEKEGSVGRKILENLLLSEGCRVFPVHPHHQKVLDLTCYPDIGRVPEKIDLAVVAVPARLVQGAVRACGEAGVEGIVILAAGDRAGHQDSGRLEKEIREIRKKYGMRILGPGSMGFIRPHGGLNISSFPGNVEKGTIAFVSQGKAFGRTMLEWGAGRIGFSMFASLGSMSDVDLGDLVDFLGEDRQTRSIFITMESVGNARKFLSAARGFARNKPIIVLRPGRALDAAATVRPFAPTGSDRAYSAAFRRVGVIQVGTIDELFDAAKALHPGRLPWGPRLAIVTDAEGPGFTARDALIAEGGRLAEVLEEKGENPIVTPGGAEIERYVKSVKACLNSREADAVLMIFASGGSEPARKRLEPLSKSLGEVFKPILAVWMGGRSVPEAKEILSGKGIPVYETPQEAVKAFMLMYRYRRNLELIYETPSELPLNEPSYKSHLKAFITRAVREGRRVLTEGESKDFFLTYGIPVILPYPVRDIGQAVEKARELGYPVMLKMVSLRGGRWETVAVEGPIGSEKALREVYPRVTQRLEGDSGTVTLQKQIEEIDYRVFLGMKKDKEFGSTLLFGIGGKDEEDVSVGLPPLNQTLARRLIEETPGLGMFLKNRETMPEESEELEKLLVRFSNLVVGFPEISTVDPSPVAMKDGKATLLDTGMTLERDLSVPSDYYPHLAIAPYPLRYLGYGTLSDETLVLLRPIRPEDEPLLGKMLSDLSEETIRARFFSALRDLSHEMLSRFCNIDYDRQVAIVAEVEGRVIGVSRLIIGPDGESAEFAILLHDQFQGKGLGKRLMETLIGIARERNLKEIYGTALTENRRALRLVKKMGFELKWQLGGTTEIRLALK